MGFKSIYIYKLVRFFICISLLEIFSFEQLELRSLGLTRSIGFDSLKRKDPVICVGVSDFKNVCVVVGI